MRVIATAGHVDHGKSTLVRALTGTDPDRWAAERARGLTIDLGYAWTTLPGGETLAFVDVPGHQRFIANTLAGIGPAPAVMLVVSADEGWRQQTTEHLDAVRALGVRHLLVAVTRSDLADPEPVINDVRDRLHDNGFDHIEIIPVSAVTDRGMDDLRAAFEALIADLPEPDVEAPVRLWIDRSFTIKGAGTVVTGTLGSGLLAVGDVVQVAGQPVTIRGLHSLEQPRDRVAAIARVAVNLRGIDAGQVVRGDQLLAAGRWHQTQQVDVRFDREMAEAPNELMAHIGTAGFQVRVRRLGDDTARLQWSQPRIARVGDRVVLRDPGRARVLTGAVVLDIDPPAFTRRGAAARRAEELSRYTGRVDAAREVGRRGFMRVKDLESLGGAPTADSLRFGEWLVDPSRWEACAAEAPNTVTAYADEHPLQPRMPAAAFARAVGLPDAALVEALAAEAGIDVADGRVGTARADLGAAEPLIAGIEQRLTADPFNAPEREDLGELSAEQIAAAVGLGRLIDLGGGVLLLPSGPARAMRTLAGLPQPFTTSQARAALETTRRVAIPLLEHLDARGWTRRVDASHREVVR